MKNVVLIIIILVVIAVLAKFVIKSPTSEDILLNSDNNTEMVDESAIQEFTNTNTNNQQQPTMTPPENSQQVEMITTDSGLQYGIITPGSGEVAKSGDLVTVHYIGTLTDGTEFDSSVRRGSPAEFPIGIGQLIKGWDEGIPGMKVGEKRLLVVPGDLAYGATPPGNVIPPNATLVFQVELLGVRSQ